MNYCRSGSSETAKKNNIFTQKHSCECDDLKIMKTGFNQMKHSHAEEYNTCRQRNWVKREKHNCDESLKIMNKKPVESNRGTRGRLYHYPNAIRKLTQSSHHVHVRNVQREMATTGHLIHCFQCLKPNSHWIIIQHICQQVHCFTSEFRR